MEEYEVFRHNENMTMQNTEISKVVKMKIFSRNDFYFYIDCEAVLTSTHTLCYGAKTKN